MSETNQQNILAEAILAYILFLLNKD